MCSTDAVHNGGSCLVMRVRGVRGLRECDLEGEPRGEPREHDEEFDSRGYSIAQAINQRRR
eukprot:9272003-Pyramimonas_sp.AAC.1